jgi:hypothetical protein
VDKRNGGSQALYIILLTYKARCMEPKQAVLESNIDYVKIEINGKLELVCVHKYGY